MPEALAPTSVENEQMKPSCLSVFGCVLIEGIASCHTDNRKAKAPAEIQAFGKELTARLKIQILIL